MTTPLQLLEAIERGLLACGHAVERDGNAIVLDFGTGPTIIADALPDGRVRVRSVLAWNGHNHDVLPGCTSVTVKPGTSYARPSRLVNEAHARIESRKVAIDNCTHRGDVVCNECGKELS